VFLQNFFNWKDTNFYLLDGNSGEKQIAGMNHLTGENFYNSLSATREFCLLNGIEKSKLFLINAEQDWKSGIKETFDLCYSFKAFGFHWPINDHLISLYENFVPGAYLLFETRSTNSQIYEKASRHERAVRFVDNQIRNIDRERYKLLDLDTESKHPIIALQRI